MTTVEHDSWGNMVFVEDEAADAVEMGTTFRERVELELDVLEGALSDFDANTVEQIEPQAVFKLADVLASTAGVLRKAAARQAHKETHNGRPNETGAHFGRVAGRGDRADDPGRAADGEEPPAELGDWYQWPSWRV